MQEQESQFQTSYCTGCMGSIFCIAGAGIACTAIYPPTCIYNEEDYNTNKSKPMHLILRSLHNAASENTGSKYQVKIYTTLKYMYEYIHTHTQINASNARVKRNRFDQRDFSCLIVDCPAIFFSPSPETNGCVARINCRVSFSHVQGNV